MRSLISFLVILSTGLVACSGAAESMDEATLSPEPTTLLADRTIPETTIIHESTDTPVPTFMATNTPRPTDGSSLEQDLLSYTTEMQKIDTQWWKTLTFGAVNSQFIGGYEINRAWLAVYSLRDLEALRSKAGSLEPPTSVIEQRDSYLSGMDLIIATLYLSIDDLDLDAEKYDQAISQAAQRMQELEEELELEPYQPEEDLVESEGFISFANRDWDMDLYYRLWPLQRISK